jgi:hypothetical protein
VADAIAAAGPHDLWLLDANLPDGSGIELLARLRERHPRVPALAHTADDSPSLKSRLLASGFAAVLVKPLTAVVLQRAVRQALELDSAPEPDAGCGSRMRRHSGTTPWPWRRSTATPTICRRCATCSCRSWSASTRSCSPRWRPAISRRRGISCTRCGPAAGSSGHAPPARGGAAGKSPEEARVAAQFDAVLRQTRSGR